ncbi:unnamed protein product [Cylindrotheca closterium]|uniref:Uncharacterized protein n=1 Tax=Cylindrotheca closterium TaxID=2856 RepID=A0AAD2CK50_9STRA|nr:unnamed protein product [Cylindrotheca closterium]
MKMAEPAKQLRSGGKVSLSATMKKKNDAIAKLGGKAEAILDSPPAPHLYSQWVHFEYVPGTQKTKSVVVTMHRFLMFSMVTIGSFKKEWETARRLRIEVAFQEYFTNGLVTSATLVDSKGMKLMKGDHAAISAGFERSAKEQTEPGKKQPHSTFYITYVR